MGADRGETRCAGSEQPVLGDLLLTRALTPGPPTEQRISGCHGEAPLTYVSVVKLSYVQSSLPLLFL